MACTSWSIPCSIMLAPTSSAASSVQNKERLRKVELTQSQSTFQKLTTWLALIKIIFPLLLPSSRSRWSTQNTGNHILPNHLFPRHMRDDDVLYDEQDFFLRLSSLENGFNLL